MPYPMILPWLARKAGVSLPAARRIWDQVLADSEGKFGPELRGSAYWRHNMAEFRRRLHGVSRRRASAPAAGGNVNSLFWVQAQILCAVVAAWTGYVRGACFAWPRLLHARQRLS